MGEEIDEDWLADALRRYAADRTNIALRDAIQERTDWLAQRSARRYSDSGEPFDDLLQVARFALFKAIERYDPEQGVPFAGFATPTVMGELKRHFRDHTWSVRVPRRAKELRPAVNECVQTLTSELGRSPRVDEIARHLKVSDEAVIEALEANNAYRSTSLDTDRAAHVSTDDRTHDAFLDRELVASLLVQLPERERDVLYLRFYEDLTQSQIAERIGVSQVHAGRILAKSLARLRSLLDGDPT